MKGYDPVKDEIIGCKEGTLTYYHEYGHKLSNKLHIAGHINTLVYYSLIVGFSLIIIYLFSKNDFYLTLSLYCLIIIIAGITFEELLAWVYAIWKWI